MIYLIRPHLTRFSPTRKRQSQNEKKSDGTWENGTPPPLVYTRDLRKGSVLAVSDPGLPSAARASAASSRAASPSRSPLCLLSTVSRRSLSRLFSRTATRTGTKERKKESDNAWEGWEDGMPSTQGFSGEECGASRRAVAHPRASTSSYLSSQFLANSRSNPHYIRCSPQHLGCSPSDPTPGAAGVGAGRHT